MHTHTHISWPLLCTLQDLHCPPVFTTNTKYFTRDFFPCALDNFNHEIIVLFCFYLQSFLLEVNQYLHQLNPFGLLFRTDLGCDNFESLQEQLIANEDVPSWSKLSLSYEGKNTRFGPNIGVLDPVISVRVWGRAMLLGFLDIN